MTRRALWLLLSLLIVGVFAALMPDVALAAGNDVGPNLGNLLEQYAGEIYAGLSRSSASSFCSTVATAS